MNPYRHLFDTPAREERRMRAEEARLGLAIPEGEPLPETCAGAIQRNAPVTRKKGYT